jgi:cytochrome c5
MNGCSSSKKNSTEEKNETNIELISARKKVPGITMQQLRLGNKIYIRDCSGCHALHKPSEFTAEKWPPILDTMFVKAKISDSATKALITDYLIAKSK